MGHDLGAEFKSHIPKNIDIILKPFLSDRGFYQDKKSVNLFTKDSCQIEIIEFGFHPHDYPWGIDVKLKKNDTYKAGSRFNYLFLTTYKEKIAPIEDWKKKAIGLDLDQYDASTFSQIDLSIKRIIRDLEVFCSDFLSNDFKRFDYAREIQYLEYLLRLEVFGTYYPDGTREFELRFNEEID